ncbi:hypothetical protein JAAARDRAFT_117033 [Jaapia argillacea MUCL 33604]|uniref:Protein-lysine N-methyltransferase EFM6 n=1 Tax=Jaapia argillacea MUCL 33604 TaxID=933084 RepID=A0A067QQQ4_9AGAM|nr:hypothetical protein JAAARDRAFT_117033 [Jaapia argillacea MUCL 33604]
MQLSEIAQDEELDALDPLRHLRQEDTLELLPPQPISIQNGRIQLEFPSGGTNSESSIVIKLAVDSSPGCGGIAWPAGEVLATYLARRGRESLRGKTILELGSGTGLVGLVAGILGGSVWITDQSPLLENMVRNVEINDLSHCVSVAELNWGEPISQELSRPADMILAADCVYSEPAFPLLVKTLDDLVHGDSSEVLLCYKKRRKASFLSPADKRFFTLLKKKFTWVEVEDDPNHQIYAHEAISLLRLSKKH